jgi:hypothetical protein
MKMRINASYSLALLFVAANSGYVRLVESASARLTKTCFNIGEAITIRFINVDGEGIFVGLYPEADLTNGQQLPALISSSLKKWVLTCGRHDNCDNWPSRGFVDLSTDGLDEGDYVIAVSGDRASLNAQATTRDFHVGDCTSNFFSGPTGSSVPEVPTPQPVTIPEIEQIVPTPRPTAPTPQPVTIPEIEQIVQTPRPIAPTPQPIAPSPQPVPFQETVQVVSSAINSVIDDARIQIENMIRNDRDLTGKVS